MTRKKLKTIGILGGMGPEAGAYLLERIIHETVAERDQDHPPIIVYSLPQVPDRTEAILHGGPSPVPALRRGLRTLERAGADFAVMSCISAHYFYPRIAPRSPLPLLSLIDETLAAVKKMRPVPRTIGLVATTRGPSGRASSPALSRPPGSRSSSPPPGIRRGSWPRSTGKRASRRASPRARPGGRPRDRGGPRPSRGPGHPGRLHRGSPGPQGGRPARSPGRTDDHRRPGGHPPRRRYPPPALLDFKGGVPV